MLLSLSLILLVGFGLGSLLYRFGLPPLLGMMLAGIILGPFGFDVLSQEILMISPELRKMALIVILLRGGLTLNLRDLKRVGRPAALLCFVPALFEIAAITLLAPVLFHISTLDAALMGSVLAAVSPAVVVPRMIEMIGNKKGTNKSIPQMIMAGASVDDVFVIVVFTTLLSFLLGEDPSITLQWIRVPVSILSGFLVGMIAGRILAKLFQRVSIRDTAKVLILLSLSFLFVTMEEAWPMLPYSGLLSVMTMGISFLGKEPDRARRVHEKFSKIWVAAEILLFVLVGSAIHLPYLMEAGPLSAILILCGLLFRFGGVWVSTQGTLLNGRERLFCGVAYMPKATVQAAIGSIPLTMGLSSGNLILTVAVLSIFITAPAGALGIDHLQNRLLTHGDTP